MKDSDRDLIAALADGSLPPEEAAALEARMAGDPAATAELEAQRTALAALSAAGPARLTDAERTELRRTLTDQLGLETEPAPTVTSRRRWRFNWAAVTVAAAAVFAIAIIAPLTNLLSTSGSDDAAEFAPVEASEELDAEAALTEPTVAADVGGSGLTNRTTGGDAPATTAAATTVAESEDAFEESAAPPDALLAIPDAGAVGLVDLEGFLDRLLLRQDGLSDDAVDLAASAPCEVEATAEAPEELRPLLPLTTLRVDDAPAVVWGNITDPAQGRYVVTLTVDECTAVLSRTAEPAP